MPISFLQQGSHGDTFMGFFSIILARPMRQLRLGNKDSQLNFVVEQFWPCHFCLELLVFLTNFIHTSPHRVEQQKMRKFLSTISGWENGWEENRDLFPAFLPLWLCCKLKYALFFNRHSPQLLCGHREIAFGFWFSRHSSLKQNMSCLALRANRLAGSGCVYVWGGSVSAFPKRPSVKNTSFYDFQGSCCTAV